VRNHGQTTCRPTSVIAMLAAVPYLLLSTSQDVQLRTVVNLDGSGLREYRVSFDPDRHPDVRRRLLETTQHFDHEYESKQGSGKMIVRDWRPANLAVAATDPDAAATLQIAGITQKPFALFTEYHWSEELSIYRETATDIETFGEEIATLSYKLNMPGKIVNGKTNADSLEGGTAVWELSAGVDTYTLEATSRRLRWGYLLLMLYVLGFIAFQIVCYVTRVVRNRPRKI